MVNYLSTKNRIYYMTIDEFEFMIEVCCNKNVSITSIIDSCSDNDAATSSQKFNVMMHLHQLSPEGISDRKVIVENRDYLFDDLINSMQKVFIFVGWSCKRVLGSKKISSKLI